jgi:hypothetical protein
MNLLPSTFTQASAAGFCETHATIAAKRQRIIIVLFIVIDVLVVIDKWLSNRYKYNKLF